MLTSPGFGIVYIDTMHPRDTMEDFDRFLASQGIRADLVIIGGAALALQGTIDRPTRDCDVLEPLVDAVLADYARRFAAVRSAAGHPLAVDWLNHGPSSLVQVLPVGWRDRIEVDAVLADLAQRCGHGL